MVPPVGSSPLAVGSGLCQLPTANCELLLRRLLVSGVLGLPHVHRTAELRSLGHDDLRRLDVAVDAGAGDELDAVVRGDVAGELSLDGHVFRSEEHTSELQSHSDLVCRLLLEKKNITRMTDECTQQRDTC